MICSKCKKEIPDNVIYCPMCGAGTGRVPLPPAPIPGAVTQQNEDGQQDYAYINGQIYDVLKQDYAKKKAEALKIAGIILACCFVIIVVGIVLIVSEDSGSGSIDNVLEEQTVIDFVLSGTYDEEGREIVYNMSEEEIGYVFEGKVYIPIEEGYVMVCDMDGRVIGRTDDTTPEAALTD